MTAAEPAGGKAPSLAHIQPLAEFWSTIGDDATYHARDLQSLNRDGSQCKRRIHAGATRCWQHAHGIKAKWRSLTKNQALTFILTIASIFIPLVMLFVGSTVIGLLPGPKVFLGVDIATFDGGGCVAYVLKIGVGASPDEVIEQLYVTAQFPGNVVSYKFGAANATLLANGTEGISAFVLGKDESGECTVKQAAITPSPDFTATQAGPRMVQIRGTNVLPRTMVAGVFAMSRKGPAFDPAWLIAGGYYKYQLFGFPITKHTLEMPHNS